MRSQNLTSLLWLVLPLAGCATAPRPVTDTAPPAAVAATPSEGSPAAADSKVLVEEILSADAEIEAPTVPAAAPPHPEVPVEINANVQKWIDYFTVRDRDRFATFLERGLRYKDLVQTILTEEKVPREMYYLAMIESGYVTHARSRARAVGAWQFMPATGKRYGLKRDFYVDERRDIVRSTRAAAHLLRNLHTDFGSWYLALGAYNAGDGRIRRAIRKGKSRDFWQLAAKRRLPRETMNYVPKFLAAVIIGRHPERYGFADIPEHKIPALKAVSIPPSVHLREVARAANLTFEQVHEFNPHLLREITPRGVRAYDVWLPTSCAESVASQAQGLARFTGSDRERPHRRLASVTPAAERASRIAVTRYKVRRGDTLESIARFHKVTVAELKRMNRLKGSRIRSGQRLRLTARG